MASGQRMENSRISSGGGGELFGEEGGFSSFPLRGAGRKGQFAETARVSKGVHVRDRVTSVS